MHEVTRSTEPDQKPYRERLIALAIFGLLVLNYPLLQLFDRTATWLGIPVIYLYLFGLWALFIAAIAWILETRSNHPAETEKDE